MRRSLLYSGVIVLLGAVVIFCVSRGRARRAYKFPSRTVKTNSVRLMRSAVPAAEPPATNATVVESDRVSNVRDLRQQLRELLKGKPSRQRMDAVFELGKRLGAEDFDGAVALVKDVPVEWMRSVLVSGIFFSRGRLQGRQTLDVEGNFHDLPGVDDAFAAGGAMVGWASAEPQAALAFAQEKQDRMLPVLGYAAWGLQDLNAALAHANSLPPGQDDFLAWAKGDPERAVDFAMTLDEALRPTVFERIAQGWASNWSETYKPDFASYLYIAISGNSGDFISDRVSLWWAQYEPQAAVEHAAGLDPKEARDGRLRAAFTCWAEADTGGAMQWWNNYCLQHGDGRELSSRMIDDLAESNPEKAAQMLDSMPALAGDAGFRSQLLSQWMQWDARAAFDWIAGKHADHETMISASRSAGVGLARWNFEDALDWARSLPDSSLQPEAMSGVALVQGYAGPGSSTDWIREMPPGAMRDLCVFAYVRGVLDHGTGSTTPNESLLNVDEPNLPELARAVQQSALSEGDRQRLLGLIYGWRALP